MALLIGPVVALIGVLAAYFVLRTRARTRASLYSARRNDLQRVATARRAHALDPHAPKVKGKPAPAGTAAYPPLPPARAPEPRAGDAWDSSPTRPAETLLPPAAAAAAPPQQFESSAPVEPAPAPEPVLVGPPAPEPIFVEPPPPAPPVPEPVFVEPPALEPVPEPQEPVAAEPVAAPQPPPPPAPPLESDWSVSMAPSPPPAPAPALEPAPLAQYLPPGETLAPPEGAWESASPAAVDAAVDASVDAADAAPAVPEAPAAASPSWEVAPASSHDAKSSLQAQPIPDAHDAAAAPAGWSIVGAGGAEIAPGDQPSFRASKRGRKDKTWESGLYGDEPKEPVAQTVLSYAGLVAALVVVLLGVILMISATR